MLHLNAGELIALKHQGRYYIFLVLSKSAFFGCQWTFSLYQTYEELPTVNALELSPKNGFVALIDFIEPRRSNEVISIAKKINVDAYMSFARTKALIRSYPFGGTALWYIYDQKFAILEKKQSLSAEELQYPIGSGMKASEVFELVDARWSPEVLVSISESGQYPRQAAGNPFKLTY
jgi:hypothetical protein